MHYPRDTQAATELCPIVSKADYRGQGKPLCARTYRDGLNPNRLDLVPIALVSQGLETFLDSKSVFATGPLGPARYDLATCSP